MINYLDIFERKAISYNDYRVLIDELLAAGKTTGVDHAEAMLEYSKMNVQRMKRLDKTLVLSDALVSTLQSLPRQYKILVITEAWCGDAAQIVPVIHKIAEASLGNLDLKFILRDENLPIIDAHLTNGGRAIPVLLVFDEKGDLVMPKWGPRPTVLQQLMQEWKAEGVEMPQLSERLHTWYAKDKTAAIQEELTTLLKQLT